MIGSFEAGFENFDRYDQVPLRLSNLSDQDNIKGYEESDGDEDVVECWLMALPFSMIISDQC